MSQFFHNYFLLLLLLPPTPLVTALTCYSCLGEGECVRLQYATFKIPFSRRCQPHENICYQSDLKPGTTLQEHGCTQLTEKRRIAMKLEMDKCIFIKGRGYTCICNTDHCLVDRGSYPNSAGGRLQWNKFGIIGLVAQLILSFRV